MTDDMDTVTRLTIEGKEIILIGTAHVSRKSAEQVKEIIEAERPDAVCIELDEQRYHAITEGNKWRDTDIFKVIKDKKASFLLINLAISSFQRKMANQFGIQPGQEMLQGIASAKEVGATLVLADRNIQITFSRIWHNIGFWGRMNLLSSIVFSIFGSKNISEEELEALKSKDMLNGMLNEFTEHYPRLKVPLIDERDQYLAMKIKSAPGDKVVAVLGAAHVPGITKQIHEQHDLTVLDQRPPKSKIPAILGWAIPLLIVAVIIYTFFLNPTAGMEQTLSLVLWTGSFSALGAALALGHPVTIAAAFVAAPIGVLHPLIAAGWISGLVQAFLRKPNVGDFETLPDDVTSARGFWRNKVTRILLIVVLSNLGTTTGLLIGGSNVVKLFFDQF